MDLMVRLHEKLDKIAFVLLCVLMADCCITGAGRLIEIGSWGLRMVLFFAVVVLSIPSMLVRWQVVLKNRFVQWLILFLAMLALQAVRGIVNANTMRILITDVKGYLYFAMLPVSLCLLTSRERIRRLMQVMMAASFALSLIALFYVGVYCFDGELFNVLADYVVPHNGTTIGMIAFTAIGSNQLRVFCYSGLYFLCACAFSLYFKQEQTGKFKLGYSVVTAVPLFMLLMSFTRSVYLAVFVAALAVVVALLSTDARSNARLWKNLLAAVAVFLVLLGTVDLLTGARNLEYAVKRTLLSFQDSSVEEPVEPTEETDDLVFETPEEYDKITLESDNLRAETVAEYKSIIGKNPIFGSGLGVALECRDDGYGEYFYLDLMAKMGIVGLIVFLMPLGMCITALIPGWKKMRLQDRTSAVWIAVLAGLMSYSYFNPYMNAALGVLFYSLTMAVSHVYQPKNIGIHRLFRR